MPSLRAPLLIQEIVSVLQTAKKGKGRAPAFLTAYQILNQLPTATRQGLETTYCPGGRGGGKHYSAATHVARVTARLADVEVFYLDTSEMELRIAGSNIVPSFEVCALFRLDPQSASWLGRPRRRRAAIA
jgi:hypothetical protein